MVFIISTDYERATYAELGDYRQWWDDYQMSEAPDIPELLDAPFRVVMDRIAGLDHPLHAWGCARVFLASPEVRDIIEQLEPGLHDFVPCQLRYGDDGPSQPYFCVRVQQSFDPVDVERSVDNGGVKILTRKTDGATMWSKRPSKPMHLRAERTAGKHLWFYYHLFCSDELHDAIQAAGLVTAWSFEKQFVV